MVVKASRVYGASLETDYPTAQNLDTLHVQATARMFQTQRLCRLDDWPQYYPLERAAGQEARGRRVNGCSGLRVGLTGMSERRLLMA